MTSIRMQILTLIGIARRRWKLFATQVILVAVLSAVGAFLWPRKYESSTTIMIRPDRTLTNYYEVAMVLEEKIRDLNEIVYSRGILEAVADSLGIRTPDMDQATRVRVVEELGKRIATTRLGFESFRITIQDEDPKKAQKAASLVADHFIATKLRMQNRQNELAVEFYEKKVAEYKATLETSIYDLVAAVRENVDDMPTEVRALQGEISQLGQRVDAIDVQLVKARQTNSQLVTLCEDLRAKPNLVRLPQSKRTIVEIVRSGVPFTQELGRLLDEYEQTAAKYKMDFPEIQRMERQISEFVCRIQASTDFSIADLVRQRNTLESKRLETIDAFRGLNAVTRLTEDRQAKLDMNRRLYDEMKIKLEQARLVLEVSSRGENEFIILDPAILPILPSKPRRALVVAGGVAFGVLIGILAVIIVEALDTKIRSPQDLQDFNRPVIALLPDGRRLRRRN